MSAAGSHPTGHAQHRKSGWQPKKPIPKGKFYVYPDTPPPIKADRFPIEFEFSDDKSKIMFLNKGMTADVLFHFYLKDILEQKKQFLDIDYTMKIEKDELHPHGRVVITSTNDGISTENFFYQNLVDGIVHYNQNFENDYDDYDDEDDDITSCHVRR